MNEIPLFPLNTVLFPGLPLQLHIFEERYKKMITNCMERKQGFGVVLIRRGVEALGPLAEPFPIGCTARIQNVQKLDRGRLNITVCGVNRFKILQLDQVSHPFLIGEIMPFPLKNKLNENLEVISPQLQNLFKQYILLLEKAGGVLIDFERIPVSPIQLGYLMAALLQIPQVEKQELLSMEFALDFFGRLKGIYRREIALMNSPLVEQSNNLQGMFSRN